MPTSDIPSITIFEDSGVSLMRRIDGNDAAHITESDITTITRNVYTEGNLVGAETDIMVAGTVFDTLQTDARWDVDATGYNFRDDVAASQFPTGDTMYRVEYLFDPAAGENFHAAWWVYAKSLTRS